MGMGGIFIGLAIAFGIWMFQSIDIDFEEIVFGGVIGLLVGAVSVLVTFVVDYGVTQDASYAMFNSIGLLTFVCGFISGIMVSLIPFIKRILGYD